MTDGKYGGNLTEPETVHPEANEVSSWWLDLRQDGLPAASRASVLYRPVQVWSSGRSKEKVCQALHDLAIDLLMWQTECAIRDYRDC